MERRMLGIDSSFVADDMCLDKNIIKELVVHANDVSYNYRNNAAIRNVYLSINRGEIYSILGPSGCGKTTLLRCILGMIIPEQGVITFNGTRVESAITGPIVGFMPQETALINHLTIDECLNFFGQIFGLRKHERSERIHRLRDALDMPNGDKSVMSLSGGEKRRVSLAIALIHRPQLLILDEPTAEVDPLLRHLIWTHLIQLSTTAKITVVLTTHYVEEARQANQIAFMRDGKLLIEAKPQRVMSLYKTDSLLAAFTLMCKESDVPRYATNASPDSAIVSNGKQRHQASLPRSEFKSKVDAVFKQNILRLRRNKVELVLHALLPAFQILVSMMAFGELKNQMIAVYNPDGNHSVEYLHEFDRKVVNFINYSTSERALTALKDGKVCAAFMFDEKYSEIVDEGLSIFGRLPEDQVSKSKLRVFVDSTDFAMYHALKLECYKASIKYMVGLANITEIKFSKRRLTMEERKFKSSLQRYKSKLIFHRKTLSEPMIELMPPIYGPEKPKFRDFVACPMIVCNIFIQSLAFTGLSFLNERKSGLMQRLLISDVTIFHCWLGHVTLHTAIILVQSCMSMIVIISFDMYCVGSFLLMFLLFVLQGILGMSVGFLLSSIIVDSIKATVIVACLFFVGGLTGAVFAPVEVTPNLVRYITYLMPHTLTNCALRSITGRGRGLFDEQVMFAVIYNTVTIVGCNAFGLFIYKTKKLL